MTLDELTRRHTLATLHRLGGRKAVAAASLGISLKSLYNWLARWEMEGHYVTKLDREALASLPLTAAEVADIYALYPPPPPDASRLVSVIRRLCESHERLRMESQGLEVLLGEKEKASCP